MAKRVYNVKTAVDEDGDQKQTAVTVDFEGVSPEQIEALAARTLIITRQGAWRRAGSIPATDVILAKQAGTRQAFAETPDSIAARAAADPEYRKTLMAKLAALK